MCYMLPEIHLWCDTCWPLGGQHGSWAISSTYLWGIGGTQNWELSCHCPQCEIRQTLYRLSYPGSAIMSESLFKIAFVGIVSCSCRVNLMESNAQWFQVIFHWDIWLNFCISRNKRKVCCPIMYPDTIHYADILFIETATIWWILLNLVNYGKIHKWYTLPMVITQRTLPLLPLGKYLLPLITMNRYQPRDSRNLFHHHIEECIYCQIWAVADQGFPRGERQSQDNTNLLLPPATKLGQGYVFTGICDSVNRGGVPHPPQEQTPPGSRPPQSRHPLEQTPLGTKYTPTPGLSTPPGTKYTCQD